MRRYTVLPLVLLSAILVSTAAAHAQPAPVIIERHMIAQASVGKLGREKAYIVITSDDAVQSAITIKLVRDDGAVFGGVYPITEGRTTLEVTREFPLLARASAAGHAPSAFFSLVAYPEDGVDGLPATAVVVEIVWHRASDDAEVDSQDAVVRRSPKR